ncbi:MAG: hypothetical protein ABJA81_07055 [Nocardioidaceae bacterium]
MPTQPDLPELMPILSRGKHRNPRKGACFMELAGFLAGECWSDHPTCTHPLLAQLARLVNDETSDANRSRLARLIPSVIGLNHDDVRVDARIALACARTALPVVSAERQNVMAVSILAADRLLADLDGRPRETLELRSQLALEQVPLAAEWAQQFARSIGASPQGFRRHSAPNTVSCAVRSIAEAAVPNPDEILYDVLVEAIRQGASACGRDIELPAVDPATWVSVCELTAAS